MLALANSNGEIGFAGWVPAMIAPHTGDPDHRRRDERGRRDVAADNWQNIIVKGSSSIQTPADLAGKTIAVNALKGVGEVMIKAALKKVGVDPNSIKLLACRSRRCGRPSATARSTRSGRPSRSCRRC